MRFSFKSLNIKKRTTTLTVEHDEVDSYLDKELRAAAILLGGYNKYGRSIPLSVWEERRARLKELLADVVLDLDK